MVDQDRIVFRARLEQAETNLFRAYYRGTMNHTEPRNEIGGEGEHILPDTHIGTDADSVKAFVETLAKNQGYENVVWEK